MASVPALSNQFGAAKGRALVAAQARLVAVAKNRHASIMRRDPRPTGFLRVVDGRLGVIEEAVKAAGIIIYIYQRSQIGFERDMKETIARLDEIARFALETLRSLSPVGTGRDPHPGLYRDSHKLFRNGYPVNDLSRWQEGDEVSITNYVDYSRILEVGDGKFRIPNRVYETAVDIVEEKYGRDAKIEFTWRGITNSLQIAQEPRKRRGLGTRLAAGGRQFNISKNRYPTIVITPHAMRGNTARQVGSFLSGAAHGFAAARTATTFDNG